MREAMGYTLALILGVALYQILPDTEVEEVKHPKTARLNQYPCTSYIVLEYDTGRRKVLPFSPGCKQDPRK